MTLGEELAQIAFDEIEENGTEFTYTEYVESYDEVTRKNTRVPVESKVKGIPENCGKYELANNLADRGDIKLTCAGLAFLTEPKNGATVALDDGVGLRIKEVGKEYAGQTVVLYYLRAGKA